MKKILGAGFILVLVVILLPVAAGFAFMRKFYSEVPPADFPPPADAVEARMQDLEYFATFLEYDQSFSPSEQEAFDLHVARLKAEAASLSDKAFWAEIAAAVAISENGHTNVGRTNLLERYDRIPLRFYWFAEGLYIIRARDDYAGLVGHRVLAINGQDPEEILRGLDPYFGGNEPFLRAESSPYFASPDFLSTVGLISTPSSLSLTLLDRDGMTTSTEIPVSEEPIDIVRSFQLPLGKLFEAEKASGQVWHHLDSAATASTPYGASPDETFFAMPLPGDGHLIRLRAISGTSPEGAPFKSWLAEQAKSLTQAPREYLVIDLRTNAGGDLTRSRDFSSRVLDYVKPDGQVYILTDGGTFSAGIVTVAFLKAAGGERATIIGAPMGDFDQFWAEGSVMRLPNSGLAMGTTTGFHDWVNGCTEFKKCYWLNVLMNVAAGPLEPDIPAPFRFEDYASGVDTGLEAVFREEGIMSTDR